MDDGDRILTLVEAHLLSVLGGDSGRASVSFVGTDRIDVMRFGPDAEGLVRYVTLGMSRSPMTDAAADVLATDGPRAELLLTVRGAQDSALQQLAVLAASPAVEGLVIRPGARLDLQRPLWQGSAYTAVLVGQGDGVVPSLTDPAVDILPLFPMSAHENAWARVHGSDALTERWLRYGIDLRDPGRRAVPLD
ncbi:MAG TPA: suppressor of fused domain protein [Actinospica sp.]|nr:suppressor of fused domain protein [Actinospica sp.]